jgi:hypothetical protein
MSAHCIANVTVKILNIPLALASVRRAAEDTRAMMVRIGPKLHLSTEELAEWFECEQRLSSAIDILTEDNIESTVG